MRHHYLRSFSFLTASIFSLVSYAQTPTWSDQVASIIYNNCSICHHEGGIGPFTLMSYDDAVAQALNISADVSINKMPPWHANPDYTHFIGERVLSAQQKQTIIDWVAGGTPSGDLSKAPPPPVFNEGSQMSSVDLSLQFPAFTVDSINDQYRTFVLHSNFDQTTYLRQVEFLPGNASIVHHIILYYDPKSTLWDKDQADPAPGFESNGTVAESPTAQYVTAWAPGTGIFTLPYNMGIKVPAHADFAIEIHYAPGSFGKTDSTTVNLKFNTYSPIREVQTEPILNYLLDMTDGPIAIPANTIKTYHEEFPLFPGLDFSLVGVFPHMHRVGVYFKSAILLSGGDSTRLIEIPRWSFSWQGFYMFQKLVPAHPGSVLWAEATYDNTANNPDNPNNPPKEVDAGEKTTDEMMVEFFAYTDYQPGDENVILDSSLVTGISQHHSENDKILIWPNPVNDHLNFNVQFSPAQHATIEILDELGKTIYSSEAIADATGLIEKNILLSSLPSGVYLLNVKSNNEKITRKFVK